MAITWLFHFAPTPFRRLLNLLPGPLTLLKNTAQQSSSLTDETTMHLREYLAIPPLESIEIINRKKPKAGEQAFFGLEQDKEECGRYR